VEPARPAGQPTIQRLIAQARAGGGYVEYLWQKPSSGKMVPKLGYAGAAALAPDAGHRPVPGRHGRHPEPADQQVRGNISATLLWMLGIAGLALLA
jgi:two-component system NarL family sensor kinase